MYIKWRKVKNIAVLPLHEVNLVGIQKDIIFEEDAIYKMSRTRRI